MTRIRERAALCGTALLLAASLSLPAVTFGAAEDGEITAFLDGRRIPVSEISRHYCDDFSFPEIHCSSRPDAAERRTAVLAMYSAADYVTIYDQIGYFGAYMHLSQDYSSLLSIGWNDKISSFKGRNSESGRFWTDWFSTGTSWSFCCNTNTSSLGSYNNTFSSVHRT